MTTWVKAKLSTNNGSCVEVATWGEGVALRNSRHPETILIYTRTEWEAFLDGARHGEFDDLVDNRPCP